MVLGLAGGFALETFAGLRGATVIGALFGMLAANFVPLGPSCGTPRP